MTLSVNLLSSNEVFYPEGDGLPIAESDPARDYLIYGVEALSLYFQTRSDVYVSGNLFIYYKQLPCTHKSKPASFQPFQPPKSPNSGGL